MLSPASPPPLPDSGAVGAPTALHRPSDRLDHYVKSMVSKAEAANPQVLGRELGVRKL